MTWEILGEAPYRLGRRWHCTYARNTDNGAVLMVEARTRWGVLRLANQRSIAVSEAVAADPKKA